MLKTKQQNQIKINKHAEVPTAFFAIKPSVAEKSKKNSWLLSGATSVIAKSMETKAWSSLWLKELPMELSKKILTAYLTPEELMRTQGINKAWRSSLRFFKEPNYQIAAQFWKLRNSLPPHNLAERLLKAKSLDVEVLTQYCWEVLGLDLALKEPSSLPISNSDSIGFKAFPLYQLYQYFRDTQVRLRPFLEHPDQILPLFYGGYEVESATIVQKTKDPYAQKAALLAPSLGEEITVYETPTCIESKAIYGLCPQMHWDNLLKEAEAVRNSEAKMLFEDKAVYYLTAKYSLNYQLLNSFLQAAIAFENFLADITLVRRVVDVLVQNQALDPVLHRYRGPYIGPFEEDEKEIGRWLPFRNRLLSQIAHFLKSYLHTARHSAKIFLVFANFRFTCHFMALLTQDHRFMPILKKLRDEEMLFLLKPKQSTKGLTISEFAGFFVWYIQHNISVENLIRKLCKKAIFFLLNEMETDGVLLLKAPNVIDKLTDDELLKAIKVGHLYNHFTTCVQNLRLLERLTPEFCFKLFRVDCRLKDIVLATPALAERFQADDLCKLLKDPTYYALFALAENYPEGFSKFLPSHFYRLIKSLSILKEDHLNMKALAFVHYQFFYYLHPTQLELARLPTKKPPLKWFNELSNQKILYQAYHSFATSQGEPKAQVSSLRLF